MTMISFGGTFALSGTGSLASSSIIVGASTTIDVRASQAAIPLDKPFLAPEQ